MAYISKQFKQFLHPFSIKQITEKIFKKWITDNHHNSQTQDIVKQRHHTLKLQIKN